jgi:DNA-directed RNA polymerase specialized sigma24 family protein
MPKPEDSGPAVTTVIAAQRGDEAALRSLLSEHLPLIYNIVGRILNGSADVDDVVQEAMLRIVRRIAILLHSGPGWPAPPSARPAIIARRGRR